jgi:hypothetical protein
MSRTGVGNRGQHEKLKEFQKGLDGNFRRVGRNFKGV